MAHEQWRSQLDYLITLLGFAVGSGAFIKFPFYCMRNGGGAFLILYMFFIITGTIPCVFLEMIIGQFSQSGPVKVWNMCPAFKGIGVGGVVVTWIYVSYYNVNFTWYMYYFYYSFSPNLPWDHCDNAWNTPVCNNKNSSALSNDTTSNSTDAGYSFNRTAQGMTAAEEFWKFQMLGQSDGLDNLGGLRWHLVGCLAGTTVLLFLWTLQGIKVSGKLVYITVGVPNILILVFLIRGCLLPGSAEGIYYYIYPKFDKLTDPKVWIQSCSYALSSMGIAMGCIVTMSGHNRMDNNCFRDSIIISLGDSLSNFFFGFAFFAVVGHVAFQRGVAVDTFESSGYDLAFIVYPDVLSTLPLPQLWSVLTFLTLMLLAVDSMVPCVEIVIAALEDMFPQLMKRHWLTTGAVLLSLFLFGLIYTSQGGIFVVTLVDWYTFFPSTAVFGILECIVVGWCYGTKRLHGDALTMWGKRIPRVMVISFKFVCPLFLVVICCYSYSYRPPKYGDYIYPTWATAVGWLISVSSLLPLPTVFIWTVYNSQGATMKEGGIFVVTLVDWYTFFTSTLVIGILECIAVSWCYGTKRLQEDVRAMWGKTIPRVMVISFQFLCPLFLVVIFCYSLYSYRPPKYHDYIYPTWATAVGWLITFVTLLPLPTVFIWTVYNTPGATMKEKLKKSLEPNEYWRRSPQEEDVTDVLQPMAILPAYTG